MPTKNPRINVVLEKPLYNSVQHLAEKEGISLSLKVRDLIKEALELEEDIALTVFVEKR
ncbi:MAG: toxin-antitoxin system, antitoxin component, partial [Nitrospirae bacterium]|nr:toxin-antitoxin system, antitoxin component [Nitrospirota bacterium]